VKVGSMNNPRNPLLDEMELFKSYGLDFVELTVEAPEAAPEKVSSMRDELLSYGMPFVGHMPWFFNIAAPYSAIREATLSEAVKVLDVAAELGAPYVTVHPDFLKLGRPVGEVLSLTVESLSRLSDEAVNRGVRLCFENFEAKHISADELARFFDALPQLGFTLDVGHAFMGAGNIDHVRLLVNRFRDRLVHVHMHDNLGESDDHLPLGAGRLDYAGVVEHLKQAGYDGDITLEIHSSDRDYIKVSRDKLYKLF
jgi:sugar phosphate isomerase/epimerase